MMKMNFKFLAIVLVVLNTAACATPPAAAPAERQVAEEEHKPAQLDTQIGSTKCSFQLKGKKVQGRCPVIKCMMDDGATVSTKTLFPDKETLCGQPERFTALNKQSCKIGDYYIPYGHSIRVYEKAHVAVGEYCVSHVRVCGSGGAMDPMLGDENFTCSVPENEDSSGQPINQ